MQFLNSLPELVAFGIILGTMYALLSIGVSLIFGVCGVVNIAHGEFVMLGAYVTYSLWSGFGINPIATLPFSMGALFLLGLFVGRVFIIRISRKGLLASMMLTFGISIFLSNTAEIAFTPAFKSVDYLVEPLSLGFVTASKAYFVGFVLAIALLVFFFGLLKFSLFGKAIRANGAEPRARAGLRDRYHEGRFNIFRPWFPAGRRLRHHRRDDLDDLSPDGPDISDQGVRHRRDRRPGKHPGRISRRVHLRTRRERIGLFSHDPHVADPAVRHHPVHPLGQTWRAAVFEWDAE
ncbi:MAG: branched-chain amino acid ABC transporter permease [Pseudomonadota bacterium]